MEQKNTTENKRFNIMGSEVVDGFACKPKKLDPNRPIMHYKSHIFVCEGERCKSTLKDENFADTLREYVKDAGFIKGENRIKISRTNCYGACRYRKVAAVFENTKVNGFIPNNNVFLKNIHKYDKKRWFELFDVLSNNIDLEKTNFELIPMSEIKD